MKIQDKDIEIEIQETQVFIYIDGFQLDGFIFESKSNNGYTFELNEIDSEIEDFFNDNIEEIEEMIFNEYLF